MAGVIYVLRNPGLTDSEFEVYCDLAKEALVEATPKDTGFCSEQWQDPIIASDYTEAEIENDCEYAEYLDRGWSSQNRLGMTKTVNQRLPLLEAQARMMA